MRIMFIGLIFEHLVPSLWNCLASIRRCGLVGRGVPVEAAFEVPKSHVIPGVLPASCLQIKTRAFRYS